MFRFALPDEVRVHGFSFRSVIMTSNACGFLPSGIMCKKGTTRKSIAGPLPAEDTHASINLKNCVRTPARRIPAANRGMFRRRQLASPTRTPTSAAAFTGAASKPLASRRDRRSPFGVFGALHGGLQEIPSRSVGDLTEVLDIFGRSTRCLWKHTSKSCARVS